MLKEKILLLGFFIILTMGCSDHDGENHGHSHDNSTSKHDSIN